MKIRVITLKQPWASLVANGLKIYEFRNMNYSYRGKILIHAGKGFDKDAMERVKDYNLDYPTAKILAEVEIVDCIKIDNNFYEKLDFYSLFDSYTSLWWCINKNQIDTDFYKLNYDIVINYLNKMID